MSKFNINQLTKEMVVARLSELRDPSEAAADIAKKTLLVTLKDVKELDQVYRRAVFDICQGMMVGLLLREQDLAKGAVRLLRKVGEVAVESHLDSTEMMELALRGIADLRRFVDSMRLGEVSSAVETEFMGAGLALGEMFRKVKVEKAA